MRRNIALLSTIAAAAFGCGNGAVAPDYKPPYATLQGAITSSSVSTSGNVHAALVWYVADDGQDALDADQRTAQEVSLASQFPVQFQLDITSLPPEAAMNTLNEEEAPDPPSPDVPCSPGFNPDEGAGGARPEYCSDDGPPDPGGTPSPGGAGGAPSPGSAGGAPSPGSGAAGSGGGNVPPTNFRFAAGTIVIYEDTNQNGKLDLIPLGATQPVDHVLGVPERIVVFYIEGQPPAGITFPFQPGFNLFRDSATDELHREPSGSGDGGPPSGNPSADEEPALLPLSTVIEIALTSDPKLSKYICQTEEDSPGISESNGCLPQPDGSCFSPPPDKAPADAPQGADVTCYSDGSFTWEYCPYGLCGSCQGYFYSAGVVDQQEADCASWQPPPSDPCAQLLACGAGCYMCDDAGCFTGTCGPTGTCSTAAADCMGQ